MTLHANTAHRAEVAVLREAIADMEQSGFCSSRARTCRQRAEDRAGGVIAADIEGESHSAADRSLVAVVSSDDCKGPICQHSACRVRAR